MSTPCIFCSPSPDKTLFSNTYAYCRFDDYPVTPGHLLIIPYRHIISFFDATNAEQAAMMDLVRSGKKYLDGNYHPRGYNIAINDGEVAGQTVMHLHIHLIPRYPGDMEDPKSWIHSVLHVSEKMLNEKESPEKTVVSGKM